ncbi:hypothetical protein [Paraburkholderia fungorum]|uniref:hypothetical protein n=1 Tax=Paraburkholderia fungorum TaxID=134537 RepID=UPI003D6BD02D
MQVRLDLKQVADLFQTMQRMGPGGIVTVEVVDATTVAFGVELRSQSGVTMAWSLTATSAEPA